jgi:hypothetical protein
MKSFAKFLEEDGAVAVNNVGGGQIAGVGVGAMGEPPGKPKFPLLRRRNKRNNNVTKKRR